MNDDTSQGRRRGLPHRVAILAAAAALAPLMAACGSSPSPGPGPAAYSACMHRHGVTGARASPPLTSFPTSSSSRGTVSVPAKAGAAMRAFLPLAPQPGRPAGPG